MAAPMTDPTTLNTLREGEGVEWRRHPHWPYEVSRTGLIRNGRGQVLRPWLNHRGYERVRIGLRGGTQHDRAVHRLVYETWVGPVPGGLTINHKDGRKRNNHVNNLEVLTSAENSRHAAALGLLATGDRNGARLHPDRVPRGSAAGPAKLTEEQVVAIRTARAAGERLSALSARYGVSGAQISRIVHRACWTHV